MYPREYFDTYWRSEMRNEVFVAMPFHDEFTPNWEKAIKPAIENDNSFNLKARRVDASTLSGSIVVEIMDYIAHARIVLADISISESGKWKGQRNGNVMYEVGLTHALRQVTEIVLIRSDHEEINFDVAGINIHEYNRLDLDAARKTIASLIIESIKQTDQSKSLKVQRAIDMLDSASLEILFKSGIGPGFKGRSDVSINGLKYSSAITRLQIEGIVKCIPDEHFDSIYFIFTDFGNAVLKKLGIRK
jgi:hypothetical protein